MDVFYCMKVSVLIPTHNHANYIEFAIRSVLAQKTNFEFEILIGENASTDGTKVVAQNLHEAFPDKIRLFNRPKDIGMFENMKELVREAKGEYIAWLEGDDYWIYDGKLQKQADFLDQNPDFVLCANGAKAMDENHHIIGDLEYRFIETHTYYKELQRLDPTILERRDFWISNWFDSFSCVMFRNGLVNLYPEWMEPFQFLDWPQYLLLLERGNAKFMEKCWTAYRLNGTWNRRDKYEEKVHALNHTLIMYENMKDSNNFFLKERMLLTLKELDEMRIKNPEFITQKLHEIHMNAIHNILKNYA